VNSKAWREGLIALILVTQEAVIRKIMVRSQPQANSSQDPILKISNTPLSPCFFNIVLEFLARAKKQEEDKRVQIGKEVKLFLFADDMILYLKDLKNSTKKYHKHLQQSSKIKISLQKSVAFLYTYN
jgi:hypothetical protein